MTAVSFVTPWVRQYAPDKAYNGYTLFAPRGGAVVWLIDMYGQFVHCWEMPCRPGEYGVLLPSGNLLYAGKVIPGPMNDIGGFGGMLLEADWESNIIWRYEDPYQHHAFYRMDNGNTMVLRWVPVPDDIAARVKGGIPGTERKGVMWTDSFQEITPAGEVAWEWLGYEHLDPAVDICCPLCLRNEWTHANSCFVMPNGDILTTFYRTNTIAIIDKRTGDIKWRWGMGELGHPHDATMLDNGNILVFDNGKHRPGLTSMDYSRVLEVNPETGKVEWEYRDTPPHRFYAPFISGCQRLANGNTLICGGPLGKIFEVTPDGEVVWEFVNPLYFKTEIGWDNGCFRAYRYSPDYEGLRGKILDPHRVELTLRKKPMGKGNTVEERLAHLGY